MSTSSRALLVNSTTVLMTSNDGDADVNGVDDDVDGVDLIFLFGGEDDEVEDCDDLGCDDFSGRRREQEPIS